MENRPAEAEVAPVEKVPFISSIATAATRWSTRWVPDAYVIAVILTVIAALMAMIFARSTPLEIIKYWGDGFWVLLTFAMQMSLIILTGYVLATSPPMGRLLNRLASVPKTPRQAVLLMALVSMIFSLVNWGLSIVGSAVFVRYVARKVQGVDYRLLVATAYLGLGVTWHAGLSASAPLLVATPKHFLEKQIGVIPVSDTIFTVSNLVMVVVVIAAMAIIAPLMMPRKKEVVEVDPELLREMKDFEPPPRPGRDRITPADAIEHSPWINIIIAAAGIIWLIQYFYRSGPVITLDIVNFAY